jgi:predicted transcriptional regulator
VEESVLVRDIVALFVERKLRMIVVTDVNGRACGAVHDSQLLREIQDVAHGGLRLGWASPAAQPASFIMRSVTTISETAPLREAVTSMATAHQRQLLVVDEHGFPIGLLVDVDALHGLHARD